jgi:hypothetical protein
MESMNAEGILATARSGHAPGTWTVWSLRRNFMRNSILRWSLLMLIGFAFFIPALIAVAPTYLSQRGFSFVITGLIIIALAALAFGSLSIVVYDCWRLAHANDYWLVITPDDYVKAEPRGKVTHVPIENIEYVTLKGVKRPIETVETPFVDAGPAAFGRGMVFGLPIGRIVDRASRRRMATPTSLAFLDNRTNREVVVATDNAFDDLSAIDYILNMQTEAKRRQLMNRSRSRSG